MYLRCVLISVALFALSAPAHALTIQEAPAAVAPSEAEMEAATTRFEARMKELEAELDALIAANAGNPDAMTAKIDEVVTRYQPDFDALIQASDVYFNGAIASAATPDERQQLEAARAQLLPLLRDLPDQVRNGALAVARQPK
ncbi:MULTISPECIES: hypothetical protein [Brevundimonas]|uniref:hypothetical protein n=1 Tax=Brevundimonas pishanensis TaxID=2896315 RepID=UPI001FA7767B|nr:hypothetical protein [Brevundimonas pishanensis]